MSVFVSDFQTWQVVHDDASDGSHTGTIDPATITHTTNMDGSPNHNCLVVTCPVCGAVSTHPAGGGAQPELVQQLFVTRTHSDGCPCGAIAPGDASASPEGHVQLNCNRMDGPGRWRLDAPLQRQRLQSAPNTFQVIYRSSDRWIVGIDPEGSVATGNVVGTLDQAEYEVLMRTDPAYLSTDGAHVQVAPPA